MAPGRRGRFAAAEPAAWSGLAEMQWETVLSGFPGTWCWFNQPFHWDFMGLQTIYLSNTARFLKMNALKIPWVSILKWSNPCSLPWIWAFPPILGNTNPPTIPSQLPGSQVTGQVDRRLAAKAKPARWGLARHGTTARYVWHGTCRAARLRYPNEAWLSLENPSTDGFPINKLKHIKT